MPTSASRGLTCGPSWGSSWRRLHPPRSRSLCPWGPAPWSLPRRPQGPRAPRGLPPSGASRPGSSPAPPMAVGSSSRQDCPALACRRWGAATPLPITAGAVPAAPAATAPASAAATAAAVSFPSLAPGPQGLLRDAPTRQARASAQVATAVPGQLEQPLACCHGCWPLPTLDSGTYPPRRLTAQPPPLKTEPWALAMMAALGTPLTTSSRPRARQ